VSYRRNTRCWRCLEEGHRSNFCPILRLPPRRSLEYIATHQTRMHSSYQSGFHSQRQPQCWEREESPEFSWSFKGMRRGFDCKCGDDLDRRWGIISVVGAIDIIRSKHLASRGYPTGPLFLVHGGTGTCYC
jgi:hypothetical protein